MTETRNDYELRNEIANMLSGGMETEAWPRADTAEEINRTVLRLRIEAGPDLDKKLIIAGFTDHIIEEAGTSQSCRTCMYYLQHRKICELPELMLPVEPDWSCRLWRI